ncbi:MAG: OsmC family protein [Fimbriimonadaceae bacterium]|nr:OsmC family protein [Fimbriimonadaceae bacterium]QYK55654.1 MAG: OsmC family protein [Fimbriimonadaceae bacterium]
MAKMHEYPVSLEWHGGRDGSGRVHADRTKVDIDLSVPPEYGGSEGGAGTNPEELLTAAVTACYSITFGIIAVNRKLPYVGLDVKAVGEVEENGPNFTYTKVTVRPTIKLAAEATDDQVKMAEDMAHKADAYCIITNAIRGKVEIVVEPTIVRA